MAGSSLTIAGSGKAAEPRRGTSLREAVRALKPPGPAAERPPRTQPEILRSTHAGAPASCPFRVAYLEIDFGELHQTKALRRVAPVAAQVNPHQSSSCPFPVACLSN
ncbi:hypothetical protein PVAP13_9KG584701 [Panicum virgatum]|uniref:Uncharacterized protein n=1 Tax=Panicum virgatum TaxID=38727 RepID=A0A8T0P289_PANVG|nr:hypothetical protein PVAP13_9KG584701 [Panicum virgatum]